MTTEIWYLLINTEKKLLGGPSTAGAEARDIADLKHGIKQAQSSELRDVDAADLTVWQCKYPTLLSTLAKDELQEHLLNIYFSDREQVVELANGTHLADLELGKQEVLLVRVPDLRHRKAEREPNSYEREWFETRRRDIAALRKEFYPDLPNFPEEQKKNPVWTGRPYSNHAEPIGLYNPVFNKFQAAMVDPQPCGNAATYDGVRTIFAAFSHIYEYDSNRAATIKEPLEALLGAQFAEVEVEDVDSDGAVIQKCGDSTAYLLIEEVRNEIGRGPDPYMQGSFAYRKCWMTQQSLVQRCCCPSIILAIAGPWMCVVGGVFVDRVITQPLTNYIWLGGEPYDSKRLVLAARLFTELKSAISSLREYYKALEPNSTASHFPYITEYGPDKVKFTYLSRLAPEQPYTLLYKAALDDMPDTPVAVKFVNQYNPRAHRLLAAQGLAPRLHYSSTEDNVCYGKRFLIVMDYVDLKPLVGHLNDRQYERVQEAIDLLHSNNIVFGDLRPSNVLVGDDTVMLVDFDWCGEAGKDCYPLAQDFLDGSMSWHSDVGPHCLMSPDHDMYMLRKLRL